MSDNKKGFEHEFADALINYHKRLCDLVVEDVKRNYETGLAEAAKEFGLFGQKPHLPKEALTVKSVDQETGTLTVSSAERFKYGEVQEWPSLQAALDDINYVASDNKRTIKVGDKIEAMIPEEYNSGRDCHLTKMEGYVTKVSGDLLHIHTRLGRTSYWIYRGQIVGFLNSGGV